MLSIRTMPLLMKIAAKLDTKPIIERLKDIDVFSETQNDDGTVTRELDREKVGLLGVEVFAEVIPQLGKVADAYGIINDGNLLDEFSADELHKRSGKYIRIQTDNNEAAVLALNGIGIRDIEIEQDGALRIGGQLDRAADMSRAIVNAGIGLEDIHSFALSLEDYYLNVTGGQKNA